MNIEQEETLDLKNHQLTDLQIKNCLKKVVESVTDDCKQFLISREWWKPSHTKFQLYIDNHFPGTHLVAHPDVLSCIDLLKLDTVQIPDKRYIMHPMKDSQCHTNCYELF